MSDEDDKKLEEDMKRKNEQRKRQIAEKKYAEEKRELNKKSFTSFGKLILSKEKSSPIVSFTAADRNTKGVPSNWTLSENANISFSKSGKRLFAGTVNVLPVNSFGCNFLFLAFPLSSLLSAAIWGNDF